MKFGLKTLVIYMAALSVALAQTNDIADETEQSQAYDEQKARSVESERGRLANQRIQAETEIRAREDQQRLEEAERDRLRTQEEAIKSKEAIAPSSDISRTLKQLRSLGELKDDGYITEEEFRRIKQKILDSQI